MCEVEKDGGGEQWRVKRFMEIERNEGDDQKRLEVKNGKKSESKKVQHSRK